MFRTALTLPLAVWKHIRVLLLSSVDGDLTVGRFHTHGELRKDYKINISKFLRNGSNYNIRANLGQYMEVVFG